MKPVQTAEDLWISDLLLGRRMKAPARSRGAGGAGGANSSAPHSGTTAGRWTGAPINVRVRVAYPGRGSKADVRGRLSGIGSKRPQVMVKITGGGKSLGAVKRHMSYIARTDAEAIRDGMQPVRLEDQDGTVFKGAQATEEKLWQWLNEGPQMEDVGGPKQAFNIIFSMPEGTDHDAVGAAVRATAQHEFEGHQWVMAQHHDEPHPHVHVHVKAEAFDGQRLNPRKADLLRWRERFAYELRQRGVEAEATKRSQRLERKLVDKPWPTTRLEEAGKPTNPKPPVNPEAIRKWNETERAVSQTFHQIIQALNLASDRASAKELFARLQTMSPAFRELMRERSREPDLSR